MDRTRQGAPIMALALGLLGTVQAHAIEPGLLAEVMAHARGEAAGAVVIEVGIEEGWDGPIADVELGDGTAIYVSVAEGGLTTLGIEREEADGDMRRIAARIEEAGVSILSMPDAYRIVLETLATDPERLAVGAADLYEIEYEIEYGRLVLEMTFRRWVGAAGSGGTGDHAAGGRGSAGSRGSTSGHRRGGEITLYVDPRDGRILTVEYDD